MITRAVSVRAKIYYKSAINVEIHWNLVLRQKENFEPSSWPEKVVGYKLVTVNRL